MIRTTLYLFAGVLLGLLIHVVVILMLPTLTPNSIAKRLAEIGQVNKTLLLADVTASTPNPLRLDPDLVYAVCRLDLRSGPGELSGSLPLSFWSVAVYDPTGTVTYSTTNRDGGGQALDIGLFDPAQTRLLAEQKIDVDSGLLIVESQSDDIFLVVRLAPPQPAMRERYKALLSKLNCHQLKT
jgi:uncharacterized membrane protein